MSLVTEMLLMIRSSVHSRLAIVQQGFLSKRAQALKDFPDDIAGENERVVERCTHDKKMSN